MQQERYYRGQIYYVYPGGVVGSEQEGGRPAIIVSNDVNNEFSSVFEVVFLTTREKVPLPTHVPIRSTNRPSIALCEQIESVSKERFGSYINEVSEGEMKNLEKAMLVSLQISTNLKGSKVLETWRKMMEEDAEPRQERAVAKCTEETEPGQMIVTGVIDHYDGPSCNDATADAAYIKLETERDVYKGLYMDLLKTMIKA